MNNRNGSDRPADSRRRVCSLTHYGSALAHKRDLPRRSLHNLPMSSQLNWSVEEELKRRRRLAGFDQSYGEVKKYDSDSDPDSGETMETDEHEWKQVRDRKDVGSDWQFWQMENIEYVHEVIIQDQHLLIFHGFIIYSWYVSA